MRLEQLRPCDLCGSPVAGRTRKGNALDFYRVVVEHQVLDMATVREHVGLTLALGSEQLASVFRGRDRGSEALFSRELLICAACRDEGKAGDLLCMEAGREIPVPEVLP